MVLRQVPALADQSMVQLTVCAVLRAKCSPIDGRLAAIFASGNSASLARLAAAGGPLPHAGLQQ